MWRVYVPKPALKNLARFPERDATAIWAALDEMKLNPLSGDIRHLRGSTYRRRVRAYRIIFDLTPAARFVQFKTITPRPPTNSPT